MAIQKLLADKAMQIASNPKVHDALGELATKVGGELSGKLLQRLSDGPSARKEKPSSNTSLGPRNGSLPVTTARMSKEAQMDAGMLSERSGMGLRRLNATKRRPDHLPVSPERVKPDALPGMQDDGMWVRPDDARHPSNARLAVHAQPPTYEENVADDLPPSCDAPLLANAHLAPVAQPPTHEDAMAGNPPPPERNPLAVASHPAAQPEAGMQHTPGGFSIREKLGSILKAWIAEPSLKAKAGPDIVSLSVRDGADRGIDLKVSRKEVKAYQKNNGIPDAQFDLRAYLQYERSRHNDLQPGKVKVIVGSGVTNLTVLDIDALEIDNRHSRQRLLGV